MKFNRHICGFNNGFSGFNNRFNGKILDVIRKGIKKNTY